MFMIDHADKNIYKMDQKKKINIAKIDRILKVWTVPQNKSIFCLIALLVPETEIQTSLHPVMSGSATAHDFNPGPPDSTAL